MKRFTFQKIFDPLQSKQKHDHSLACTVGSPLGILLSGESLWAVLSVPSRKDFWSSSSADNFLLSFILSVPKVTTLGKFELDVACFSSDFISHSLKTKTSWRPSKNKSKKNFEKASLSHFAVWKRVSIGDVRQAKLGSRRLA